MTTMDWALSVLQAGPKSFAFIHSFNSTATPNSISKFQTDINL